jgi:chromosome segregation ATPase
MKSKIAIIVLVLVALGLGVALVAQKREADRRATELIEQIGYHSNQVVQKAAKLDEQSQVNTRLMSDLEARAAELRGLSNSLSKVISDLERSDAQAKATAEQLRNAQGELARKDQKINELEGERTALGKQMDTLTNSISNLEKMIAETERKLATTQGEKDFLFKELTRLRAEKAELERQFNDLAVLRAQVSKLKEELAVARRLEFIRLSLFGGTAKGGAEKLMAQPKPAVASATSNYDLNVEVRQDGAARVVAPTNAAAATNAALPKAEPANPPK